MALTLLPEVFIPIAWQGLKNPPAGTTNEDFNKMQNFSCYVQSTWIAGPFTASLWSHFDHVGPRTTNLAEGWHNSLNHTFRMPHPSARNFLHWLQTCQYQVQCRQIQLQAGRAPKQPLAKYQELDMKVFQAKQQFRLRSDAIVQSLHLNPGLWAALLTEISTHLRYVSHLIGAN